MGLIELTGVTKTFAGIKALDGVDFDIRAGEIHGLVGANGAGKTTVAHILAGIMLPDAGSFKIDGEHVSMIKGVLDAHKYGIGIAFQTSQLISNITASQYLMLGREYKGRFGVVSERKTNELARAFLDRLDLSGFPADATIGRLSEACKKYLEAARAIQIGSRLVIFDETATGLPPEDAERMSNLIRTAARGGAALVISHDIPFILRLCGRVTVLREGRRVGTFKVSSADAGEIIRAIGEPPAEFPERTVGQGDVVLSMPKLNLEIRAGETVGIALPDGGEKVELLKAIVGVDPRNRGDYNIMGVTMRSGPRGGAVRHRIGLSGDERKLRGSALYITARKKIAYACVEHTDFKIGGESIFGGILGGRHDPVKETAATTSTLFEPSEVLEGRSPGELMLGGVDAVIFDEPSRGTDESVRAEIYGLMNELARRGKGIILLSLNEREMEGMCDRRIIRGF